MSSTRRLVVVVLLTLFKICYCSSCEVTFNNTAVTVLGVRGIDRVSGCLRPDGDLSKASYIQIVNETVPVLNYGAVQNLPNLVDLILDDNGIQDIIPGAFLNLPRLYLLRLKNNNIREIKHGVFNNLTISDLNLLGNSISVIAPDAFDNMPNLAIVNLDHNHIKLWNKDWFAHSPQINSLSFRSNELSFIPARAFQNIKGVHEVKGRNVSTTICLSENKISYIDSQAFEGMEEIGWLFLNKNEILELPDDVLKPLRKIEWLKLSFNKLSCVSDQVLDKIPTVSHYLDGNPLTEECKMKLNEIKKHHVMQD